MRVTVSNSVFQDAKALPANDKQYRTGSNESRFSTQKAVKFVVVALMLVVILALADLFLVANNKPTMRIDSAKLSFESSLTSDATLTVQGGLRSKSVFHTIEITASECELFSNEDGKSDHWLDIGSIRGTKVPASAADGHDSSLSFEFQNVKFASLRRLLYNTAYNRPLGAAMRCAMDVNVYMYHTVTVSSRVLIDVQVLAPTPEVATVVITASAHWAGNNLHKTVSTTDIGRITMTLESIVSVLQSLEAGKAFHHHMPNSWHSVLGMFDHSGSREMHLDTKMKNPFYQIFSFGSLPSFIVVVPALSVATTAFGDDVDGGRFVLSSTAFELELTQPTLHVQSDITLHCSDSFVAGETPAALHTCDMPGPAQLAMYFQKLSSSRVHLSMDFTKHNFVTKLAGIHHSFQAEATDATSVNAELELRLAAARAHSPTTARSSDLVMMPHAATPVESHDPVLSTRNTCTRMDTDGIFTFFVCTDETPTSVHFRMFLLDPTSILMGTSVHSAWNERGPLELSTEMQFHAPGGPSLRLNNTISAVDCSFQTEMALHAQGEVLAQVDSAVRWEWNSHNNSLQRIQLLGRINDRVLSGLENQNVNLDLSWKDDKFSFVAHALEFSAEAVGDYVLQDPRNWTVSADRFKVFYAGSTLLEATLRASLDEPGSFGIVSGVWDASASQLADVDVSVKWDKPVDRTYLTDGHFVFNSTGFVPMVPSLDSAVVVDFETGNITSISQYTVRVLQGTELILTSDGLFGAEDTWWLLNVTDTSARWGGNKLGSASLHVYLDETQTSSQSCTSAVSLSSGDDQEQFSTHLNLTWSDPMLFASELHVLLETGTSIPALALALQTTTNVDFDAGSFVAGATVRDATELELLKLHTRGHYVDTSSLWSLAADEISVYMGATKLVSIVSAIDLVNTIPGSLKYHLLALDGTDNEIVATDSAVTWSKPPHATWEEAGDLHITSVFYPLFSSLNSTNTRKLSLIEVEAAALCTSETYSLDLSYQNLTELPDLSACTTLEILNLEGNKLSYLPDSLFDLSTLVELNVQNNNLSSLNPAINRLTYLESLYLQDNKLTVLHDHIGGLASLLELHVDGNQLTFLPDALGNLLTLERLSVSNNYLYYLPYRLRDCKNLLFLYASDNSNLYDFPHDYYPLTKLRVIDVYRTGINYFPQWVYSLPDLEVLHYDNEPWLQCDNSTVHFDLSFWGYYSFTLPSFEECLNIETLDLTGNYLQELPLSLFRLSKLTKLWLGSNRIPQLPAEMEALSALTLLDLSYNQIQSVPEEIGGLRNLEVFNVSGNALKMLPYAIGQLTSLTALGASNNHITHWPVELWMVTSLRRLELAGNLLTQVPDEISQLFNLENVDLSHNPNLVSLPHQLGELTALRYLRLQSCRLSNLPTSFVQLANLTVLDLSRNVLVALPAGFEHLTKLEVLRLENNNYLSALPADIGNFVNLRELYFGGNQVSELPASIGRCTLLYYLEFPHNRVTVLPDSVSQLANLFSLNVEHNKLTSLPSSIGSLYNLYYLTISHNPQLNMVPEELYNLYSLMWLRMSGCNLASVSPRIGGLLRLNYLALDYNQLTDLPPEISQLVYLNTLDLSGNKFPQIPPVIFNFTYLYFLGLSDSGLTMLPPQISQLQMLNVLNLANNTLQSLPWEMTQLYSLRDLDISWGQMTQFPDVVCSMPGLRSLAAYNNMFTSLPAAIGNMNLLERLRLYGNQLTSLPPEIGNMTSLRELHVGSNRLTSLPLTITNIPYLYFLDVSFNNLDYIAPTIMQKPGLYVNCYGNPYCPNNNPNYPGYPHHNNGGNDGFGGFLRGVGETLFTIFSTGWDVGVHLDYKDNAYTAVLSESAVGGPQNLLITSDGDFRKINDQKRYLSARAFELYIQENLVGSASGAVTVHTGLNDNSSVTLNGYLRDSSWRELFAVNSTAQLQLSAPFNGTCSVFGQADTTFVDVAARVDYAEQWYFVEAAGHDTSGAGVDFAQAFTVPSFVPNLCIWPVLSASPTFAPTLSPTTEPTRTPTAHPTALPTATPTTHPTAPTVQPTVEPSRKPNAPPEPSVSPTDMPTRMPSHVPSLNPSPAPTTAPSLNPSLVPTMTPTRHPTLAPTLAPSKTPTLAPSATPTAPTVAPTCRPTRVPTLRPTSAPSTAAPTLNNNAPVVTTIVTIKQRSSIALSATFDAAAVYGGSITCAAFPEGVPIDSNQQILTASTAKTTPYLAGSTAVSVDITGLSAMNLYDVYCVVVTMNGVSSLTTDTLATKTVVETACCKTVSFTNAPAFVYGALSQYATAQPSQYVFSYALSAAPRDSLVITPTVLNLDGSPVSDAIVTTSPVSSTFGLDGNNLAGKFVLSAASSLSGSYKITLVASGTSAAQYGNATVSVSVISSAAPKPAPTMTGAKFANNGGSLVISFSSATNKASIAAQSFACSELLTFGGASLATCSWMNGASLRAVLTTSDVTVGSSLTLKAALIKAECAAGQDCSAYIVAAEQSVTIAAPDLPVVPVVLLTTPTIVSSCDDVVIDPSLSTGSGGRGWSSVVWTLSRSDALGAVPVPAVFAALNSRGVNIATPIVLARALFAPSKYTLTLTLTNFLGQSSSATAIFSVDENPNLPIVSILGPSERSLSPVDTLNLYTTTTQASCAEKASTISYKWTVLENGNVVTKTSFSATPSRFSLLPYSLNVGSVYTFLFEATAKATENTAAITGRSTATVKIVSGAVMVAVVGGYSRQVPTVGQMTIDASPSYDENVQSRVTTGLTFTWTCTYATPSRYGESCASVMGVSTTSNLIVDATLLDSSELYAFQVVAKAADGRSALAVVTVQPQLAGSTTYTSINSLVSKINPDSRVSLNGVVRATYGLDCSWTAAVGGVNVPFTALTKPTETFSRVAVRNNFAYSLLVPGNTFVPGSTVTFRLRANFAGDSARYAAYSEIDIKVNAAPSGGSVDVTPTSGSALSTSFVFSTSGWTDDAEDFPLSYQFQYQTLATQPLLNLQSRSPANKVSANLPAGPSSSSNAIILVCTVYDASLSAATLSTTATVTENVVIDVTEYVNDQLSNFDSVGDVNTVGQLIANVGSTVNKVNCTLASDSFCASKNRVSCSATPQTCSSCLGGFNGVPGDSNAMCFSNARRMLTAVDVGGSCAADGDCLFGKCTSGNCVSPPKLCPSDTADVCSGHGSCKYTTRSGKPLHKVCTESDFECFAQCECTGGYGGRGCGLSAAALSQQDSIRAALCNAVITVGNNSDPSVQLLESLIGYLDTAFDPKEVISAESLSVCQGAMHFVGDLVLANEEMVKDMSQTKLDQLLKTASKFIVRRPGAGMEEGKYLHQLMATLNEAILGSMVNGQAPYSYATQNMRTIISKARIDEVTSLAPPLTSEEAFYGGAGANKARSSYIEVVNTSTSSQFANSEGYMSMVVMLWGENPFHGASAVESALLRVENHNFNSALRAQPSAQMVGEDAVEGGGRFLMTAEEETDYYIVVQLNEPYAFNRSHSISEATALGLTNFTFPECTNFDGSEYEACTGCTVSTYTDYNVTFACSASAAAASRRLSGGSGSSINQFGVKFASPSFVDPSDDGDDSPPPGTTDPDSGRLSGNVPLILGVVIGVVGLFSLLWLGFLMYNYFDFGNGTLIGDKVPVEEVVPVDVTNVA